MSETTKLLDLADSQVMLDGVEGRARHILAACRLLDSRLTAVDGDIRSLGRTGDRVLERLAALENSDALPFPGPDCTATEHVAGCRRAPSPALGGDAGVLPSVEEVLFAAEAFRQAEAGGAAFGERSAIRGELRAFVTSLHTAATEARAQRDALQTMGVDKAFSEAERNAVAAAEARREVVGLRAQLPAGMKHCTILSRSCDLGHTWLTAANWSEFPCPWCAINEAKGTAPDATPRGASPEVLAADEVIERCAKAADTVDLVGADECIEAIRSLRGTLATRPTVDAATEIITRELMDSRRLRDQCAPGSVEWAFENGGCDALEDILEHIHTAAALGTPPTPAAPEVKS